MLTANEARNRTKANSKDLKWNIFDSIQLKLIELKIRFWSGLGRDYIFFDVTRPLVRDKLEKAGFKIVCFGGANVAYPGITWEK